MHVRRCCTILSVYIIYAKVHVTSRTHIILLSAKNRDTNTKDERGARAYYRMNGTAAGKNAKWKGCKRKWMAWVDDMLLVLCIAGIMLECW
jgi:hypothetical protein